MINNKKNAIIIYFEYLKGNFELFYVQNEKLILFIIEVVINLYPR